jgi:hypothetical protein
MKIKNLHNEKYFSSVLDIAYDEIIGKPCDSIFFKGLIR